MNQLRSPSQDLGLASHSQRPSTKLKPITTFTSTVLPSPSTPSILVPQRSSSLLASKQPPPTLVEPNRPEWTVTYNSDIIQMLHIYTFDVKSEVFCARFSPNGKYATSCRMRVPKSTFVTWKGDSPFRQLYSFGLRLASLLTSRPILILLWICIGTTR